MTDPLLGKGPEDVLLEILGIDAYCAAQVDYLIAGYLSRDAFGHELLEGFLLARVQGDRKRRALGRIIGHAGLDEVAPWDKLVVELERLAAFRDRVSHSQPDRGDVLRRLRRTGARNEIWEISGEELRAHWYRAIACQSQVLGLTSALSQQGDGPTVSIGKRGVVSTPVDLPNEPLDAE